MSLAPLNFWPFVRKPKPPEPPKLTHRVRNIEHVLELAALYDYFIIVLAVCAVTIIQCFQIKHLENAALTQSEITAKVIAILETQSKINNSLLKRP